MNRKRADRGTDSQGQGDTDGGREKTEEMTEKADKEAEKD